MSDEFNPKDLLLTDEEWIEATKSEPSIVGNKLRQAILKAQLLKAADWILDSEHFGITHEALQDPDCLYCVLALELREAAKA